MKKGLIIYFFLVVLSLFFYGNSSKHIDIYHQLYRGERIERASNYLIVRSNSEHIDSYTDGNGRVMFTIRNNNDYEYRYIGNDVNNYVYFNCSNADDLNSCELWRIIGVFYVEDDLGNYNYRIKLMKPEVVTTSDLEVLNDDFLDGIQSKYQRMIGGIKYQVNGIDNYYSIGLITQNDIDQTHGLGFGTSNNSWLVSNSYPVVYLKYDTVITAGNGSINDAYVIESVNDSDIQNESDMSLDDEDLNQDLIDVDDTKSNWPAIFLTISILVIVIGILIIGINFYKSRKIYRDNTR